jgi:hypothetical protein
MRSRLTLLLAATAVLAGSAAHARGAERTETTRADVERRTADLFGRMDLNRDGLLSGADRDEARRQAFDRLDADKDGAISPAEFEAQHEGRRDARAGRGEGPVSPGERRFGRRGVHGFGNPGPPRAADTDGDGAVSHAEFASAALARFDRADADGDGTISLEERREARQHMRRHMRRGHPGRDAG